MTVIKIIIILVYNYIHVNKKTQKQKNIIKSLSLINYDNIKIKKLILDKCQQNNNSLSNLNNLKKFKNAE